MPKISKIPPSVDVPYQKIVPHPFTHAPCPSTDYGPHVGKKGNSNSFQTNFTQNFTSSAHFQEYNNELFEKVRLNQIH